MSHLLSPLDIGSLHLPNRVVMAPLTRNRAGEGNVPTELNVTYYAQRASAGLIITEATQISPQGVGYPNTPGIHSPQQVAGWRKVTAAVHERGGRIALQLWHVGRISHPSLQPDGALPVAPSAIRPAGNAFTHQGLQPFETPRALELAEIGSIVAQYGAAARNAKEAEFDAVEIHGANGYLIDQFLQDGTNTRSDRYGGSIENRCRFALEVVEAVVAEWGPKRVGIRLSPNGTFNDMHDRDPKALFGYLLRRLNEYPLAYVHVVEAFGVPSDEKREILPLEFLRECYRGVLMTNGGYTQSRAEQRIAAGLADLVSFGELFIANPDLVERFAANAPLNEPDRSTYYGGGQKGYTDYPTMPKG